MAAFVLKAGDIVGEIITAACAHIVEVVRTREVASVNSYQHKQREVDTVPFLDVYSKNHSVAGIAQGYVYNQHAVYPEMVLRCFSFERMIVKEHARTSSREFVKALVIFRASEGRALRLWVEITKKFAGSNNYQTERSCCNASKQEADFEESEADAEERRASEDYQRQVELAGSGDEL